MSRRWHRGVSRGGRLLRHPLVSASVSIRTALTVVLVCSGCSIIFRVEVDSADGGFDAADDMTRDARPTEAPGDGGSDVSSIEDAESSDVAAPDVPGVIDADLRDVSASSDDAGTPTCGDSCTIWAEPCSSRQWTCAGMMVLECSRIEVLDQGTSCTTTCVGASGLCQSRCDGANTFCPECGEMGQPCCVPSVGGHLCASPSVCEDGTCQPP